MSVGLKKPEQKNDKARSAVLQQAMLAALKCGLTTESLKKDALTQENRVELFKKKGQK